MKKVVLNPNPSRDLNLECTKRACEFFKEHGVAAYIPDTIDGAEKTGAEVCSFSECIVAADMIVSFGGDGTLLDTANQVAGESLPILGINIGRIGYMAELESHELEMLKKIIDGDFKVEERMRIDVSVVRNDKVIYKESALNDAVIMKTGLLWTVDMDIFADDMFISRYSGDGVIVATPTGSTAYSLSAGGPVIDPSSKNITITPVCTHALSAKPIVLSCERTLKIFPKTAAEDAIYISVDGDDKFNLSEGDCVTIKMSEQKTRLIHVKNTNFYDVLYTKLSDRRFD